MDVQRAAVTGLEQAVIGDGVAGIESKGAARDIGVDRAGHLVDQRQIAVADADLADAGNGVIDVGQDRVRVGPNDLVF